MKVLLVPNDTFTEKMLNVLAEDGDIRREPGVFFVNMESVPRKGELFGAMDVQLVQYQHRGDEGWLPVLILQC
jgi:hypothetical protein